MDKYEYVARDYHDDLDLVYYEKDRLIEKLQKNKLVKDDRELLLSALEVIVKLREGEVYERESNSVTADVIQGVAQPCQKGDKYEKFKDFVLEKEQENKIIMFAGTGEIMEADIDEFIKQSAEGILYDLNRNKTTVLTFIEEQKWVNDYALSVVVEKLKALLDV